MGKNLPNFRTVSKSEEVLRGDSNVGILDDETDDGDDLHKYLIEDDYHFVDQHRRSSVHSDDMTVSNSFAVSRGGTFSSHSIIIPSPARGSMYASSLPAVYTVVPRNSSLSDESFCAEDIEEIPPSEW